LLSRCSGTSSRIHGLLLLFFGSGPEGPELEGQLSFLTFEVKSILKNKLARKLNKDSSTVHDTPFRLFVGFLVASRVDIFLLSPALKISRWGRSKRATMGRHHRFDGRTGIGS
jgi:hypothetical protein